MKRNYLLLLLLLAFLAICCLLLFRVHNKQKSEASKNTIQKLTSIFENSTTELQYGYCEDIDDGRGYTFGFAGFTSGTYDGTMILKEYQKLDANNKLVKYIPVFEQIDSLPHDENGCNDDISGLSGFPEAVETCKDDKNFQQAQHNIVDNLYWKPSQKIADDLGAKYAITRGELYDTYINHGEDGAIEIVEKTNQLIGGTPKSGVDEIQWLSLFLDVRYEVLAADKTWQEAVDRVTVYRVLLEDDNLTLTNSIDVTCYGDRFCFN